MIQKYSNLTPKEHVDRFYSARSQMSFLFRDYHDADDSTVEVLPNIRLGITRSKINGSAIVHMSHFESPSSVHYARFRLNDISRRSTEALDIVDQNYDYVDPNDVPLDLPSLAVQTDLAFIAVAYLRKQKAQPAA